MEQTNLQECTAFIRKYERGKQHRLMIRPVTDGPCLVCGSAMAASSAVEVSHLYGGKKPRPSVPREESRAMEFRTTLKLGL